MDIETLRTPGLGDSTYLLAHEGLGIVVDPQRDIDRFVAAADAHQVAVRYVLETHLHNDYISGARELARRTGAELVLPAGTGAAYDHLPAFHTEEFEAGGGLRIRPLHTPGHTPEHVSYVVLLDAEPVAVFSGGSLLVGSAGRSDLLGDERARSLALLQYGSLRRLAALGDGVGLYPTHGQGSFCTSSGAGKATSSIGEQRRNNAALAYPDAESFVKGQLSGLQPYPDYYARMAPINLTDPTPPPDTPAPEVSAEEAAALGGDVWVLDGRPRTAFAAGHIPGSIGIELEDQFGVWAGWLLPFNAPLLLVLEPGQDGTEAVTQLARIGFDDVRGILRGMQDWPTAERGLASFERSDPGGLARALAADGEPPQILDVRAPGERDDEPLERAIGWYVPDLADALPEGLDPQRPVWTVCASGFRSSIAASLVQRHGLEPILVDGGGVSEVHAQAPDVKEPS